MFGLEHGLNSRGTVVTHGLNPISRVPKTASSYAGRANSAKYEGKVVGAYEGKIRKE